MILFYPSVFTLITGTIPRCFKLIGQRNVGKRLLSSGFLQNYILQRLNYPTQLTLVKVSGQVEPDPVRKTNSVSVRVLSPGSTCVPLVDDEEPHLTLKQITSERYYLAVIVVVESENDS